MLIPSVSVLIPCALILAVLIASDWYLWRPKVVLVPALTPTNALPSPACQYDRFDSRKAA
jgi:hypothetical protein